MDIFGQILEAYLESGSPNDMLSIERDDGFLTQTSLEAWIQAKEIPDMEIRQLSKLTKGSVLDIGCGTGRHLKWLEEQGFNPYGIDSSPGTVAHIDPSLRDRVIVSSVWDYIPPDRFDNIIIMDNTIGLIGKIHNLYSFLLRLSKWMKQGGLLAISSLDWRNPMSEIHKLYQNMSKRIYKGEVQIRLRYKHIEGDFFDWVWVDPDILIQTAMQVGFNVYEMCRSGNKYSLTLQWQECNMSHDPASQEFVLGNSTMIPDYNFNRSSYGNLIENYNVRVEQFGPFRLSFSVSPFGHKRFDVLQYRYLFEHLTDLLDTKPLIGGSLSPLSRKLPIFQSDYDFYLPVADNLSIHEVSILSDKLESFDFSDQPWKKAHFSFIYRSWLRLPYFCEVIDPCDEENWSIWSRSPKLAEKEYTQRLNRSIDYLSELQDKDIIDGIERFYGARIEREKIFRIISTPRWFSLNDSHLNRLRNICSQDP